MPLNCGVGEDSWESLGHKGDQISQSYGKSTLNTHWKDRFWGLSSCILVTWCKQLTHWKKIPDIWKSEDRRRRSEDDMAGWHHWCNVHELGQTLGNSEGQKSLMCWTPWGCIQSDMTGQLKKNNKEANTPKNVKCWWNKSKMTQRKDTLCSQIGRIDIAKMYYPKQSTDSMQSL